MILLVLVAALWIVVLAPSALRRLGERQGAGSIDHFHHQLRLLEHVGPKLVAPAYRLRTAKQIGLTNAPSHTVDVASSQPKLVLLRPVDEGQPADIDGKDGVHYERVGVLETPEPSVSIAETRAELAVYRRQQARRRCTVALRLCTGAAISTGVLGMLPSLHLAWILTGLTGLAALVLVGLISYARELEVQRRRPRPLADGRSVEGDVPAGGMAQTGYPGAWDEQDQPALQRAAANR